MTQTMSDTRKQAFDLAKKYGIKLSIVGQPEYRKYFKEDKEERYVFKCKLSRNGKSYTFTFGQSIADQDQEPDIYDILACLTKYDPEDFEWFCKNYGYNEDSRTAEKIYKAVCKEWAAVQRLFPDILDELSEIG